MELAAILRTAHEHEASDIHLVADHPPMIRINTVMTPLDYPVLEAADLEQTLHELTNEQQQRRFKEHQDLDFSYEMAELNRYRVNAHMQRGVIGIALRLIKTSVPELESLNLPEVISRLTVSYTHLRAHET